ncbi:MAG: hypothetical protein ORN83_02230, partial [Chthoniobacteraceae bacterium]|nr:hypothetical protein [Chthoniobacteraceae bacterium]
LWHTLYDSFYSAECIPDSEHDVKFFQNNLRTSGIAHVTAGPIELQQQSAPTSLEIFDRKQTSRT